MVLEDCNPGGELSRGSLEATGMLVFVLTGGTDAEEDAPDPAPPSPSSVDGTASDESPTESGGGTSSTETLAWEDTPEGWLAGWAESRGIDDPPQVAVVRKTRPEEMGELVAECVREQGFDATAFPDGSWETVGAPGQGDAAALAEYRCIAQYPLQPQFYQPLDDDHLRQSYEWHMTTTIPCLHDLGYTTPEPPSVEVYIETYRAQGAQWMAQQVGSLPQEAWDQCPPTPPAADLFPSG